MTSPVSLSVDLKADHSCNWRCCWGCKDTDVKKPVSPVSDKETIVEETTKKVTHVVHRRLGNPSTTSQSIESIDEKYP